MEDQRMEEVWYQAHRKEAEEMSKKCRQFNKEETEKLNGKSITLSINQALCAQNKLINETILSNGSEIEKLKSGCGCELRTDYMGNPISNISLDPQTAFMTGVIFGMICKDGTN